MCKVTEAQDSVSAVKQRRIMGVVVFTVKQYILCARLWNYMLALLSIISAVAHFFSYLVILLPGDMKLFF